MIQKTLRTVAMTLISFYQVDHTFDRSFVIKYLTELEALLKVGCPPSACGVHEASMKRP